MEITYDQWLKSFLELTDNHYANHVTLQDILNLPLK